MASVFWTRSSIKTFKTSWRPLARYLHANGHNTGFVLFNSLTQTKEPLITNEEGVVTWYACGPTVYDDAHIGHARAYVCQDILKRALKGHGLSVRLVMGMTDVDDKILKRAQENNMPWIELARKYEQRFLEDMSKLGVEPCTVITRVSDFIPEIVSFVQSLVARQLAYVVDGSVYFDIKAFSGQNFKYGKLQPLRHQDHDHEHVSENDDARGKKSPRDFALWKASSPSNNLFEGWTSPWGFGRPGWHIECSVMSSHVFGASLDLHSGGIDLQFPHHDNEIAQCEAFHNTHSWCSHFFHVGHVHVQGLKMSKSLKNFTTIRDFLSTNTARHFRLFCLQHHYSSTISFTSDRMRDVDRMDKRIHAAIMALSRCDHSNDVGARSFNDAKEMELIAKLHDCKKSFWKHLRDDLDTPQALAVLIEFVATINTELISFNDASMTLGHRFQPRALVATELIDGLEQLLKTLGLSYPRSSPKEQLADNTKLDVDLILNVLASFRSEVKQLALSDNFSHKKLLIICDDVRDKQLPSVGIQLSDLANGQCEWQAITNTPLTTTTTTVNKQQQEKTEKDRLQAFDDKRKIAPSDLFRNSSLYSAFDELGLPTHDEAGLELSSTKRKKLRKQMEQQAKLYQKWLEETKQA